jgi:GNAT superfamily N-acetyltransferase
MTTILKHMTPPSLAKAIRLNQIEWMCNFGNSPTAELYESTHLRWWVTNVPHPLLSGVLSSGLSKSDLDDSIREILSEFEKRNVSRFAWWEYPSTQSKDLMAHLIENNFAYEEGLPGMAVDLMSLPKEVAVPNGLMIQPVEDKERLEDWASASLTAYEFPEAWKNDWFDLYDGLGFDLPMRNYVGYLKEAPVATAELYLAGGVAGVYVVGTVPRARRMGIGTALTLAPLLEARSLGYRIGVLGATPMGEGVYRKLGFEEFCKLSYYTWKKASS